MEPKACPEEMQKYLIFYMAKYLKIPLRYWLPRKLSKIKIQRPLYLLYLSLQYLRYYPTLVAEKSSRLSIQAVPVIF